MFVYNYNNNYRANYLKEQNPRRFITIHLHDRVELGMMQLAVKLGQREYSSNILLYVRN